MKLKKYLLTICLFSFLLCSACSSQQPTKQTQGKRDNTSIILEPSASGEITIGNDKIVFDLSHSSEGYIMVKYLGNNKKVKVQVKNPNESQLYTYDILNGYNVFPLTGGNGQYTFQAFENVQKSSFSKLYSFQYQVKLENDYISFLYPNQYVNFNKDTKAITIGREIAKSADTDLDVVTSVYNYMINNISYDDDKAQLVKDGQLNGYLPNVDLILESKKGICFDYAALMATMLRTQNIPTRMMIGYAKTDQGNIYHAWIGVYIKDIGWIDDFIKFDGKEWSMMDPTFAAENKNSDAIKNFISNQSNYLVKYMY